MQTFLNKNGKLEFIKEIWFKLEKDMQSLTEKNLWQVFWLEFVSSEFQLNNLRIDTLAFDIETNAFVIIEFKMKWQNLDIAQWLAYLSLLLNNKAEFVQKLSILKNKVIKNEEIDWTQSRVIFVSENFTEHQKESINFKDLPIWLFEMKQLVNGEIIFNEIKARNKTESIKTITKQDWKLTEITKQLETYNEEYHLEWKNEKMIELFEKIKHSIIELDPNFEIVYRKLYIAFRLNNKNIIAVRLFVNSINIWLYWKYWVLEDKYGLIQDMTNIWHTGAAQNQIKIESEDNLLKILDLIQQAYQKYWNN